MANILNLETATTNCSVSIGREGKLIALVEENSSSYSHSEQLHIFIERCLEEANITRQELDSVAVSKGPGSYTGLRIGVSAAKGLCYALDIPLIAINTLRSMAFSKKADKGFIIPMLDARRMEVYAAVFDSEYKEIKPTWAEIVNEDSFSDFIRSSKTFLVGNGAEKCRAILRDPNFNIDASVIPSASTMAFLSYEKYKSGQFEDTAYFEPFYLKDFIVTTPKKTPS